VDRNRNRFLTLLLSAGRAEFRSQGNAVSVTRASEAVSDTFRLLASSGRLVQLTIRGKLDGSCALCCACFQLFVSFLCDVRAAGFILYFHWVLL
jgi:hypothetical protein